MSRIGKMPIALSNSLKLSLKEGRVAVTGPKGTIEKNFFNRVKLNIDKGFVNVELCQDMPSSYWGLYRTLLDNMISGVTAGYKKELELQGVGYKAALNAGSLTLNVGLSHQVVIVPPKGISFEVDTKLNKVSVSGIDKETVGQVAAKIRNIKPPEPYHGKGIRYLGEKIVHKVGKSQAGKK